MLVAQFRGEFRESDVVLLSVDSVDGEGGGGIKDTSKLEVSYLSNCG